MIDKFLENYVANYNNKIMLMKELSELFITKSGKMSQKSLKMYKSVFYSFINYYLFYNNLPREVYWYRMVDDIKELTFDKLSKIVKDTIRGMDKAFVIAPNIPHDLIVYRGLQNPVSIAGKRVGQTIISKSYLSTSLDPLYSFFGFTDKTQKIILKIYVPAGIKYLMLDKDVINDCEYEILLPRGIRLKILSIKRTKKYSFYEMKIIL